MTSEAPPRAAWPVAARRGPSPLARRPEMLPVAAVAVAWAVAVLGGGGHTGTHDGEMAGMPTPGGGPAAAVGGAVVMAVAMMGLLAVPTVGRVARTSLWWRAGRSVVVTFAAFCGVWTVLTLLLDAVIGVVVPPAARAVTAGGLLLGWAVVVCLPWRTALLRRCSPSLRLRPTGGAALVDAGRLGARTAGRCALPCLVPMGAMLAAPGTVLMAALTVVAVGDRVLAGRRLAPVAAAYALLGAAVLVSA